MNKTCPKCGEEKDYDEGFYKRRLPSGNVTNSGWCKECLVKAGTERQSKAREALRILEAEGRA